MPTNEAEHRYEVAGRAVKILFWIEKDEDGYPPYEIESLWAHEVGENEYQLRNIPFFAQDVSCGDIVEASPLHGALYFERTARPSGHSTVRLVAFAGEDVSALRAALTRLGCSSERSMVPSLIAVDIPPEVDYERVQDFLGQGEQQERWEYEESCLRHPLEG